MKKQTRSLTLIALLAIAVALSANPTGRTTNAPPGTRDEIEKSFHVRAGGTLKFDADFGNAEIITGDSDTVKIAFIREFKVGTAEEANELRQKLTVELGQTDLTGTKADENIVKVTVRLADDRSGDNRRKMRLDFRITMPRKFNVDLRACNATVGDLDGTVIARTVGGDLKLGNVTGPVTARSEGGNVNIGDVGGDLEARSEGGNTEVGHVKGRVVATAEGGNVTIEEAGDSIEARTAGGSVKAWISKQPRANSKITAEAGNIDLRLNESVAVNVDAACTAGRLSSDFSLNGHQLDNPGRLKSAINGGGPLVMLRASAGNINLRK
jgi:hypothetical protein